MANLFREKSPARTCTKTYKDYKSFKKYISTDFNNKCGYTDCSDFWFGGMKTFHIDHFKPWSKYPNLKTEYSNLVYCCSYVNILKTNDDTESYLDPCDTDFNDHFERNNDGEIIPRQNSKEAQYMYKKLELYSLRYKVIWKLEMIREKMQQLAKQINDPTNLHIKNDLRIIHSEIAEEFDSYLNYLKAEQ